MTKQEKVMRFYEEMIEGKFVHVDEVKVLVEEAVRVGYTLKSGKLYCKFFTFHVYLEKLFGRPIFTYELGRKSFWEKIESIMERTPNAH